jgi:ribonuclease P protein component
MLPKKNRISRKKFPAANARGSRVFSPFFSLVSYSSPVETRIAVVVSKKVAKTAVARNTLRRRFYELLAPHIKNLAHPLTVVVYPKLDAIKIPFRDLKIEIGVL